MDALTTFVTAMIALSVGAERITEIVKGMIPWLREPPGNDPNADGRRRAALQSIAAVGGGVAAWMIGPDHFLPKLVPTDPTSLQKAFVCALLGLMASGGSALWNHVLDIIGVVKETREVALAAKTTTDGVKPSPNAQT